MSLDGKVALITGAGRGIGKRLAIGFAARGARVGLVSRTPAELEMVHLEIEHTGGAALPVRADVRSFEEMEAAAHQIHDWFGPLDILIHSAGVLAPVAPVMSACPDKLREALETNVLGLVNACRAVLPGMVGRRQGKILAIVGQGAFSRIPSFALDSATQAAAARFVESLAEEVRLHNVQANCMGAGRTYTHMTDLVLEAGPDLAGAEVFEEARQVQRSGGTPPERQIRLAEFLCTERSNHVSGKLVHVQDDWKKLEAANMRPDLYTLRRIQTL